MTPRPADFWVRRAFSLLTSGFFQSIITSGGLGRRPIEYMIQGYCAASLPQDPLRGQAVASKERGSKPHANGTVSARTYRGGVSRWDESPPLQTAMSVRRQVTNEERLLRGASQKTYMEEDHQQRALSPWCMDRQECAPVLPEGGRCRCFFCRGSRWSSSGKRRRTGGFFRT